MSKEISLEMKAKLAKYADLKSKEKEIQEEIKEIGPEIVEFMENSNLDKLETVRGSFILSPYTVWEFSEEVEKLKEKEKAEGIAKKKVTTSLRFNKPKGIE